MGGQVSSDFAVFSMIHKRDAPSEHAVKRSCVVVHCQKQDCQFSGLSARSSGF